MIQLVAPTITLKSSFLEGLREFQAEGLPWHLELDAGWLEEHIAEYVAAQLAKVSTRTDTAIPTTELWGVLDGEYVGRIAIRHELNEALQRVGGHIGYDTRPTFRGRGIASDMLKAALPVARQLGLSRVLLTCDDTNAASIRVIEKSGGVLEGKKAIEPGRPLKRYYWISLEADEYRQSGETCEVLQPTVLCRNSSPPSEKSQENCPQISCAAPAEIRQFNNKHGAIRRNKTGA